MSIFSANNNSKIQTVIQFRNPSSAFYSSYVKKEIAL